MADVSAGRIAAAISTASRLLMTLVLSRSGGVAGAVRSSPGRCVLAVPGGGSGPGMLGGQGLPFTEPWPGPRAGHGVITMAWDPLPPMWIGLPGVPVAVLIGVTVDPVLT